MMGARLRHAAMGFSLLVLPALALAQSPRMQTSGQCSPNVSGAGASVHTYCIGISREVLERLNDINVAGHGRRLFVAEAWLSPSPMFGQPAIGGRLVNEQAYVSMQVTNITAVPLLLTAAKLEILKARNLSKGGGIYSSKDSLWPVMSMNQPIIVAPGKQTVVRIAEGLELNGMATRIRKNRSLDTAFTVPTTPLRINGDEYVEWFAEQMALLYGAKAHLRLTLYEGDYKPVASLSVPLAQGVDFFYHGEAVDKKGSVRYAPRLAYDAFLGEYLQMREKWEPGFRINNPPTRVIEAIPDATVSGGMRYRDLGVQEPQERQP